MITFKQGEGEAASQFQAHVNRKPLDFWLEADTAAEAEEKLLNWALKGFLVAERDEKIKGLEEFIESQANQLRESRDEVRKMKTEAPDPEQFKSRRLFRRW